MPQMGVSVAEGTVVAWRVEIGDRIEADQTICEISTDKIDTEVPAPVSGVVTEILVPVETTVPVGEVLARIGVGGEAGAATPSPAPANDAPSGQGPDTPGAVPSQAPTPRDTPGAIPSQAPTPATPSRDAPESGASSNGGATRMPSGNGAEAEGAVTAQR